MGIRLKTPLRKRQQLLQKLLKGHTIHAETTRTHIHTHAGYCYTFCYTADVGKTQTKHKGSEKLRNYIAAVVDGKVVEVEPQEEATALKDAEVGTLATGNFNIQLSRTSNSAQHAE